MLLVKAKSKEGEVTEVIAEIKSLISSPIRVFGSRSGSVGIKKPACGATDSVVSVRSCRQRRDEDNERYY